MITLVAAMTKDRVIGKDNEMPWHISEEFKHFKETTSNGTIIMGRKTFDSIGKILPNRHNIIISRSAGPIEGADVCRSVEEALEKAKSYGKEIFVIGGSTIFEQTIFIADKMILSFIKKDYPGDAYFPAFGEEWNEKSREDRDEFEIVIYEKGDSAD